MPVTAKAHVNTSSQSVEDIASETGAPSHSRRLSDKVLAAFNHAYAVGEIEVGTRLREILAKLEQERVLAHGNRQAMAVALGQADLWVDFVEARNDYRVACEDDLLDSEAVTRVLDQMKDAYQRWSSY
jgi:hypothetical protein